MLTGYAKAFDKRVLLVTPNASQADWVRRYRVPLDSPIVVRSAKFISDCLTRIEFDVIALDDLSRWDNSTYAEIGEKLELEATARNIVVIEAP